MLSAFAPRFPQTHVVADTSRREHPTKVIARDDYAKPSKTHPTRSRVIWLRSNRRYTQEGKNPGVAKRWSE
eukprot:5430574-Amphidinium_carterae.1